MFIISVASLFVSPTDLYLQAKFQAHNGYSVTSLWIDND